VKRSQILVTLDAIINSRLFSDEPWLNRGESNEALQRTLEHMKLEEKVPLAEEDCYYRETALGKELNISLLSAFMGSWEEHDLIVQLELNDLIDEFEAERLHAQLDRGADPELVLRRRVQRAYIAYCRSGRPH
jgi:hypothetical protein